MDYNEISDRYGGYDVCDIYTQINFFDPPRMLTTVYIYIYICVCVYLYIYMIWETFLGYTLF